MQPARADGAASTRNILLLGGAAAATLLIVNHNKKVHERYAEDARRQAYTEQQRSNAQAAYESERSAYANEVALVSEYKHEVAIQHSAVVRQNDRIAQLKHSLIVAKANRAPQHMAFSAPVRHTLPVQRAVPVAARATSSRTLAASSPQVVSYGWGTL
jgi:hypothetical protein